MRREKFSRTLKLWMCLGLVLGGLLLTQAEDTAAKPRSSKGLITVNFQDTDLRVVIKFIS